MPSTRLASAEGYGLFPSQNLRLLRTACPALFFSARFEVGG